MVNGNDKNNASLEEISFNYWRIPEKPVKQWRDEEVVMRTKDGFIFLHSSLLKKRMPPVQFKTWVSFLLLADSKQSTTPGLIDASTRELANIVGCSSSTICYLRNKFQGDGRIKIIELRGKGGVRKAIQITNYLSYQTGKSVTSTGHLDESEALHPLDTYSQVSITSTKQSVIPTDQSVIPTDQSVIPTKHSSFKNCTSNKQINKKYKEDRAEIIKLAEFLKLKILENNPRAKVPQNGQMMSWQLEIDKMVRIDKRTPVDIERVINFCQSDNFWKCNILSAGKLREKYDQLYLKMETNNGYKTRNQAGFQACQRSSTKHPSMGRGPQDEHGFGPLDDFDYTQG